MNNISLQPPEPVLWLQLIIYMMPVMVILYIVMMWANHEDYKKEHNIKGWSDKDMNVKQLLVATAVSTVVGFTGYMVGTYYGSISMLDTIYGNVESELGIMESRIKDINTREVEASLEEIKQKVLKLMIYMRFILLLLIGVHSLDLQWLWI